MVLDHYAPMSEGEFDLIRQCFADQAGMRHPSVLLGIGDDASIHRLSADQEWVVTTDTSVQGVHWPEDMPLHTAAQRAVASALSDIAAMGAEAVCAWLNIICTERQYVHAAGKGVTAALDRFGVMLVGGDTVHGPVNSISVTVAGQLPAGTAMRRDRVAAGQRLWLCGRVGFAALGLQQWLQGGREGPGLDAFVNIQPRLQEGVQLRALGVRSCIDISDGLLQDARHLGRASNVALELHLDALPDWELLLQQAGEHATGFALSGGEDYALLFAAPDTLCGLEKIAVPIGRCLTEGEAGSVQVWCNGQTVESAGEGYDHFA